ncbi:SGNH/GDSL hydrolase family protein [Pontibacter burrus]|uniref:T9SS type A sorting domain-containing protein n=1 Tax=Pontibacter burrus TaxID=2704466 RepID=A0A6B3LU31_9BACT|nr:SGNH/GDSL hydrolase family protein [Pontibacter burrus]NEM96971.1 T9SS type A sorting domain-containing protein [Pontibacter burrus]
MPLFIVKILYGLILFLLLSFVPQTIVAQPVRIMCLGNSITQGDGEKASYRFPLWKKLVDAGVDFEFVGSHDKNKWGVNSPKQNASYKGKTFTNVNEGHWGWRADHMLNGNQETYPPEGKLSDWMKQYTPDIALIHLGTNDIFQNQPIAETIGELEQVIRGIRAKNGSVSILLAQLIPANKNDNYTDNAIRDYNTKIVALAEKLNTAASPVIVVDQYSGFDINTMLADEAHPNERGEEQMAQQWYNALLPIVRPMPVSLVSFNARVTDENKIELNWKTASEQNNAYFEIQRTLDTTKQFSTIGKVNGAGTTQTPTTYTFTDATAPMGDLFYRLKQVDFDGTTTYSKTILVSSSPEERMLQVFPTVVSGKPVTIDILVRMPDAPVTVSIYTINGTHVKDLRGSTSASGHYSYEQDVKELRGTGLYIVQAIVGGKVLRSKFIVE